MRVALLSFWVLIPRGGDVGSYFQEIRGVLDT